MPSAQVREQAAERRRRVVDLRAAGWSFEAIAAELGGVTPQRAHTIYREALTPRNGPVPRPGRAWSPERVFLVALGEEVAGMGTRGGRPEHALTAAARRVARRLPPGDPRAAELAAEALSAAAVLALRLPLGQARRLAATALVEAGPDRE